MEDISDNLKVYNEYGDSESSDNASNSDLEDDKEPFLPLQIESSEDNESYKDYEAEERVKEIESKWGTKKRDFYRREDESEDTDDEDSDDSDREARKQKEDAEWAAEIQREQFKQLDRKNFEIDFSSDSESGDDSIMLEDEQKDGLNESTEKESDNRKMTTEELKEAEPEFFKYLCEFETSTETLNTQIIPFMEEVKRRNDSGEIISKDAVSYLEAKLQLLLNYCVNLSFYFLLKSEGIKVEDHPVIEHLVKMKTYFEKIRPIDKKLKPQLDSLLRSASKTNGNLSNTLKENYTPTVNDLDSDTDQEKDVNDIKKRDIEEGSKKKYKVPKFSSVPYYEKTELAAKELRKKERAQRRLRRNKILKDIQNDMSDRPDNVIDEADYIGSTGDNIRKELKYDKRKTEFEEDNFIRLRETKAKKKERNKNLNLTTNVEGLLDFEADKKEFEKLNSFVNSSSERETQQKEDSLASFMEKMQRQGESAENKARKRKKKLSAEEVLIHDPVKRRGRTKKMRIFDAKNESNLEIESSAVDKIELEDPIYRKALSKKKERMEKSKKLLARNMERDQPNPTSFIEDGETREVNYKILKNKGLQPYKRKDERNPRKKLRKKYEKKIKARRGQVRDLRPREEAEKYEGEKSGLRTTIVTSRKIN